MAFQRFRSRQRWISHRRVRRGWPIPDAVDPDELRLTAWELREGRYVEVADLVEGEWSADRPYPVTVRPSTLLG